MLPESECTLEQIAARRKIKAQYGKSTEEYYNDRLIMIGMWEVQIRDVPSELIEGELESVKQSQQHIMQQCRELGITFDLDALYEAEKEYQKIHPPPTTFLKDTGLFNHE